MNAEKLRLRICHLKVFLAELPEGIYKDIQNFVAPL